MRTIRLISEAFPESPALDTAVSRALLQRVSSGFEPETLRLYRPGPIVAFGPQDVRAQGYRAAVQATRDEGYHAVNRLAGGRAAVFHEGTIAFAWTIPDPDPRARVWERFDEIAEIMAAALKSLGVDARVGEVPGEYCPGKHSVNARGVKKIMGVGQRTISRAAHVGGVLVVSGSRRIRDVLTPVYDALELDWDPEATGSVEDELGVGDFEAVKHAVLDEFVSRYELSEGELDAATIAVARSLEGEHVPS